MPDPAQAPVLDAVLECSSAELLRAISSYFEKSVSPRLSLLRTIKMSEFNFAAVHQLYRQGHIKIERTKGVTSVPMMLFLFMRASRPAAQDCSIATLFKRYSWLTDYAVTPNLFYATPHNSGKSPVVIETQTAVFG